MNDSRRGRPSCSALERLYHCPGSWALSKVAPPQETSDDAASGNRIHAVLAGQAEENTLNDDELWCKNRCLELRDEALKACGITEPELVLMEDRFWLDSELSGQADYLAIGQGKCLIVDYKTGRNDTVIAKDNRQLAGLVACASWEFADPRIQSFYVAIVAPYQQEKLTMAAYIGEDAVLGAKDEALSILWEAEKDNAPRKAGDHCHYCPALAICPEAQGRPRAALIRLSGELSAATKENVAEAAQKLPIGDLASLMDEYHLRQWANEAIIAEVKRRLKAGEDVPGYALESGPPREKIVDSMSLYARLAPHGVTDVEFCKAVTVTKEALENLTRSKTGLKGRPLKDKLRELCDGITESKTPEPSVVKKRKEIE